jgi:uncharacterized protein YozE (UPF0346 family)
LKNEINFSINEGSLLENIILFNKIVNDLFFPNKVINLNELSNKINKNIDYFNNKSNINE